MKDFTEWCLKCGKVKTDRYGVQVLCPCDHVAFDKAIKDGTFKNIGIFFSQIYEKELPTLILEDLEELLRIDRK